MRQQLPLRVLGAFNHSLYIIQLVPFRKPCGTTNWYLLQWQIDEGLTCDSISSQTFFSIFQQVPFKRRPFSEPALFLKDRHQGQKICHWCSHIQSTTLDVQTVKQSKVESNIFFLQKSRQKKYEGFLNMPTKLCHTSTDHSISRESKLTSMIQHDPA